jgi:hypothetical protein
MVFNIRIVSPPVAVITELLLIFLFRRQVLASVLFSLVVVPALAQIETLCQMTGRTGNCSQFIPDFCDTVSRVAVSSSLSHRPVYILIWYF